MFPIRRMTTVRLRVKARNDENYRVVGHITSRKYEKAHKYNHKNKSVYYTTSLRALTRNLEYKNNKHNQLIDK